MTDVREAPADLVAAEPTSSSYDIATVGPLRQPLDPAAKRQAKTSRAKRVLDISLAAFGLAVLAPVLVAIALVVRLSGPGPVVLRQKRVGLGGAIFCMLKFRTMIDGAEPDGRPVWSSESDGRVTTVGRILRERHFDELPQLWNVLVGEMSIVGPRPERPGIDEELERQIPCWKRRYELKPGITGWAQIRSGYAASVEESRIKLAHDLYYLEHCNFRLDLVILAETFGWRRFLRRDG